MSDVGRSVLTHLRSRRDAMTDFLTELVLAESPTDDPASQRGVFDPIGDLLGDAGLETALLPGRLSGGQLYARPRRRSAGGPVQVLLGHSDTVWPVGTLQDMPVQVQDGCLRGPGSYDMKGGLTQMVFALEAVRHLGMEPAVAPVVFINSDEEIGSPESRHHIRRLARVANRTLVLEPSLGPSGKLKTARKGAGRFLVTVKGKPAHAGLDPGGGASAIVELAHVIHALHELNDFERGVSVNVGTIEGGERANVVAATSRAVVDVRVLNMEDAADVEERIRHLEPATPGVELVIEGRISRPPMERTARNRALWRLAQEAGRQIAVDLEEGVAGGTSDGNDASLFSATLDGLGAVGDGAHAHHEFVHLDRMVERTALLVMLLLAAPLPAQPGAARTNQRRRASSP